MNVLARFNDQLVELLHGQLQHAKRSVIFHDLPEGRLVLRIMIREVMCNSAEKIFRVAVRDVSTGEAI